MKVLEALDRISEFRMQLYNYHYLYPVLAKLNAFANNRLNLRFFEIR